MQLWPADNLASAPLVQFLFTMQRMVRVLVPFGWMTCSAIAGSNVSLTVLMVVSAQLISVGVILMMLDFNVWKVASYINLVCCAKLVYDLITTPILSYQLKCIECIMSNYLEQSFFLKLNT